MRSLTVGTDPAAAGKERWYSDWQNDEHASHFDGRSSLLNRMLVRNYESFNDVRLLNDYLVRSRPTHLLEVGCATGEFYRYMRLKHPRPSYTGIDISLAALERARQKYPAGHFFASDPAMSLEENLGRQRLPTRWEIVYTKDVLHHQTDPFSFLAQLLGVSLRLLVLRTRTRDRGPTVLDPESSCQYHYRGWMPYIVFNIEELIDQIRRRIPDCEVILYRNHMVLGGVGNRFLPKECYLPETGTAETAVGVFLESDHRQRVQVIDREERSAHHPIGERILHRLLGMLRWR